MRYDECMTTNEIRISPLSDLCSRTLDAMHDILNAHDESDHPTDRIELIVDFCNEIMLSNDLCPIHGCDLEICIDDQDQECAALRDEYLGDWSSSALILPPARGHDRYVAFPPPRERPSQPADLASADLDEKTDQLFLPAAVFHQLFLGSRFCVFARVFSTRLFFNFALTWLAVGDSI
jgi:hypothetical protein